MDLYTYIHICTINTPPCITQRNTKGRGIPEINYSEHGNYFLLKNIGHNFFLVVFNWRELLIFFYMYVRFSMGMLKNKKKPSGSKKGTSDRESPPKRYYISTELEELICLSFILK
jgi:hypothetical protein